MKINKIIGYSILPSIVVLVSTVWFMSSSSEIREKESYGTLFKERLVLFKYLDEGKYSEANKLLSILLTGDIIAYERVSDDVDPKKYSICLYLNSKIKKKLVVFQRKEKNEDGFLLNLKKLEARCAE